MATVSDPSVAVTRPADFRIGSVLKQTCSVFAGNFLQFAGIAGASVLPALTFPARDGYAPIDLTAIGLAGILLGQSIMLLAATQVLHGQPIRLGESLKGGLRRFLSLVGIGFLIFLILVLRVLSNVFSVPEDAYTDLVVGVAGGILLVMFSVAMPICVIEKLGPFRGLRRSVALTKGYRWKVLFLVVLGIVVGAGFMETMRFLVSILFASSPPEIAGLVARTAVIWIALWLGFFAVLLAAIYYELRAAKKGTEPDQIAAVFE
jgi:hypothetical protein